MICSPLVTLQVTRRMERHMTFTRSCTIVLTYEESSLKQLRTSHAQAGVLTEGSKAMTAVRQPTTFFTAVLGQRVALSARDAEVLNNAYCMPGILKNIPQFNFVSIQTVMTMSSTVVGGQQSAIATRTPPSCSNTARSPVASARIAPALRRNNERARNSNNYADNSVLFQKDAFYFDVNKGINHSARGVISHCTFSQSVSHFALAPMGTRT